MSRGKKVKSLGQILYEELILSRTADVLWGNLADEVQLHYEQAALSVVRTWIDRKTEHKALV